MANLEKFEATLDSLESETEQLAKSIGALNELPKLILEIKSLHKEVLTAEAEFRRGTREQSDVIVELKSSVARIEASADEAVREVQKSEKQIETILEGQSISFIEGLESLKKVYSDEIGVLAQTVDSMNTKLDKLRLLVFATALLGVSLTFGIILYHFIISE